MGTRPSTLAAAVALGMLAGGGAVAAWFAADGRADPVPVEGGAAPPGGGASRVEPVEPVEPAASPAAGGTQAEATRSESPAHTEPAAAERDDGALFSERLQAFARAEAVRGWREVRQDDPPAELIAQVLRDYDHQLRTMAHAWGKRAAEERSAAEARTALFAGDDLVALLRTIDEREPAAKGFVASDRFAALFAARGGGSAVDGTTLTRGAKVSSGAVVSFPAGVFTVHDLAAGGEPYPSDVVVRGAGMDATLLVWDAQRARSPIERLGVEDCTVFVDNGLTDVRSQPAVLALTRVRFVGFDCGAGSAVAFYLHTCALRAADCRFEGGYGRSPQSYANLMQVHGACLARFERCRFDRVDLSGASGGGVLFRDSAFTEMLREQPRGPTFQNCRYTTIPADKTWDGEYRRRDLNDLFPQWRERLRR